MALISEGMFEDLKEIAQNSAYMDAIKKPQVMTAMWEAAPRYEELKELEAMLTDKNQLNFHTVFHKPTGFT